MEKREGKKRAERAERARKAGGIPGAFLEKRE
jgi:hypothetical protein